MSFLSRVYDWFHPYQSIINIVDHRLSLNNKILFSEQRGQDLTSLSLRTQALGVTSQEYVEGKQVIVSLTTHGKRIYEVFKSIESVMQGTWLPNRIVLWISEDYQNMPLPETLIRQQKRGLEIEYVKDVGPHTKLIPALKKFPEDIIVTIDDDMYYQYDMLENLIKAYLHDSSSIHANRVTVMTFDERERLNSYLQWKHYSHPIQDTRLNLITGVEGCLYPPHSLCDEVFNESVFRKTCPYADDVWFTAMALLQGTLVKHVYTHYSDGCAGGVENLSMQDIGLSLQNDNQEDCRNDKQIKAVFDHYNLYPLLMRE